MITPNSEFSDTSHFLGNLCKYLHDWRGTGKSVRSIAAKSCRFCMIVHATKPKSERAFNKNVSPIEFLLSRINKTDTCWLWTGPVSDNSRPSNRLYGVWRCSKMPEKFAHRAAFKLLVGEIPDDKIVMHTCDTPLCVNPSHLKLGTIAENNLDRDSKGRSTKLLGESHSRSTITNDQAREIKQSLIEGLSPKYISDKLNISIHIVRQIKSNRTWVHID